MKGSVRLNNEIRLFLRRAVLRHKFQKQGDELQQERQRLALEAYNLIFDAKTKAHFAVLPKGWLKEEDTVSFTSRGQSYVYRFDGRIWWRNCVYSMMHDAMELEYDQRRLRVPNCYEHQIKDEAFALAVQRVEQRQEKLQEAVKEAYSNVHRMLNSYTTIRTLKEAWPEIAPFIPAEHEPKKAMEVKLPAVRPAILNAMLDLPV